MRLTVRSVIRRVRNRAWKRAGCVDPEPREVANRATAYFAECGYQMRWQDMLDAALDSFAHDKPSCIVAYCKSQRDRGIRGSIARWEPGRVEREERNRAICEAKDAGESCAAIAERYGLTPRHVRRIVAAGPPDNGLQPPGPDDSQSNELNLNVVTGDGVEGQCPALLEMWTREVGEPSPTLAITLANLESRCDQDSEAGGTLWVDAVRIMQCAAKARDPVAYLHGSLKRLGGEAETMARLRGGATEKAVRYADYGHVKDRRAYLATCNRNDARS